MSYNMTSEDFVHKYTVNIPKSLWGHVKARTAWGTRYNNRVSGYIINLIEADIEDSLREAKQPIAQYPCPDPARKYHGFQFKLGNPFRLKTFGKKLAASRNYSEKENT